MSWIVVLLLVGFWALGLLNGYSFGGLIYIFLMYAGLIGIARVNERCRISRSSGNSQPVAGSDLNPKDS
jgi:hypothetical protein